MGNKFSKKILAYVTAMLMFATTITPAATFAETKKAKVKTEKQHVETASAESIRLPADAVFSSENSDLIYTFKNRGNWVYKTYVGCILSRITSTICT